MIAVHYLATSIFNKRKPETIKKQEHDKRLFNAKKIEIRARLINWGKWQRINNIKPINDATGVRNVSLSAVLMMYAPKQEKTGYYEYNEPLSEDEDQQAAEIDHLIKRLSINNQRELFRFYAECAGTGAKENENRRYAAINKLVLLSLTNKD